MSAEEELFSLAGQDMPVTSDEVRQAMNAWAHELAEKQRQFAEEEWAGGDARMILRRRVARHLADLIDPAVSCSSGCSCVCHTADTSPCDDCSGVLNSGG